MLVPYVRTLESCLDEVLVRLARASSGNEVWAHDAPRDRVGNGRLYVLRHAVGL